MTCTWLYVLIDGSQYYVGITYRLGRRINEHVSNHGSLYTSEDYQLVTAYKICDFEQHDYDLENMLTLQIAKLYGANNVTGGKYCKNPDSIVLDLSKLPNVPVCNCSLPVEIFKSQKGQWYKRCSKSKVTFLNDCEWYEDAEIEPCNFFAPCTFKDTQYCVSTLRLYEWSSQKRIDETPTIQIEDVILV